MLRYSWMRPARAYRDQLRESHEYQTAAVSFWFPAAGQRLTRQEFDKPLPRQNVLDATRRDELTVNRSWYPVHREPAPLCSESTVNRPGLMIR